MLDDERRERLLDAIQRGDEVAQLVHSEAVRDFFRDKEETIISDMGEVVADGGSAHTDGVRLLLLRELKRYLHRIVSEGIYAQAKFNKEDEQEALANE